MIRVYLLYVFVRAHKQEEWGGGEEGREKIGGAGGKAREEGGSRGGGGGGCNTLLQDTLVFYADSHSGERWHQMLLQSFRKLSLRPMNNSVLVCKVVSDFG